MLPPSAEPAGPMPDIHDHIADERLAELADGIAPEPIEGAHLGACHRCSAELGAYRALVGDARAGRAVVGLPLTDWERLSAALRAEGLTGPPVGRPSTAGSLEFPLHRAAGRSGRLSAWAWRSAAALLLLAGGAAGGRLSAGASALPSLPGSGADPARRVAAILADSAPLPASSEEAMAVLSRAERDYRMATAFLASAASPELQVDRPEVYQRRLAVMDEVASLTRAALAESPHDQVLNQYYLASLGAREATLRSLATALPTDAQLSRF